MTVAEDSRQSMGAQLVGTAEVAEMLGTPRSSVTRLMNRSRDRGWPEGGFPIPLAKPAAGPVWRKSDIEAYHRAQRATA